MKIKERKGVKKFRIRYIEGAKTKKTAICANSLQILASAKAGLTLDNTSRASLIVIFIQNLSFPEIQIRKEAWIGPENIRFYLLTCLTFNIHDKLFLDTVALQVDLY